MRELKRLKKLSCICLALFLLFSVTVYAEPGETEKNGDIYILFTSDIHCGIDQGFGLAGLCQVRDSLEAEGYTTLLVDNGDAIQGEPIGTMSEGEAIVDLMNAMHYDVAIPGNHEFDYGMDRFLELTKKMDYSYICCNFTKDGETVLDPYVIKEAAGKKIAFVGITTPKTFTSSTPRYFQNEAGEYIYSFMQDDTGEGVYTAVQKAVDDARKEGADYVYAMGHIGMESECEPWTYVDIISHTTGIDVFLDGHSHDTEQVVMKNRDGVDVPRSACGTKLSCIGYSRISGEDGRIVDTGIWSWPNKESAPELLSIHNEMRDKVDAAMKKAEESLNQVVAKSEVDLTVNDPVEQDASGHPIRMIRRAETNLGDFCADAIRAETGADIGIINGGGIRAGISNGDITFGDILRVFPWSNSVSVIEVTGQQVLDALEWGVQAIPDESGAFLQVSGISYEVDVSIDTGCITDENKMCVGIEGERRVKNVMFGDEPLDPEKTYTLAGTNYTLLENGDGYTAFNGAQVQKESYMVDNQILINYAVNTLGGTIGEEYADPYGQGRIKITE